MTNALPAKFSLPDFENLQPGEVLQSLEAMLQSNRSSIENLLQSDQLNITTLVRPLEQLNHALQKAWSPVSHLQSVSNDKSWRDAHAKAIPLVTDYATELSQNADLYAAFNTIRSSLSEDQQSAEQQLLDQALRDFRKAGVGLSGEKKQQFRQLMSELATLTAQFARNVQDSTDAWSYHTEDSSELDGLPEAFVRGAAERAAKAGLGGYSLILDMPSYQAVITYADNRALRKRFYKAWVTRASSLGDSSLDNRPLLARILALRHEAAQLVGFNNYAEYALDGRMAKSSDEVLGFLNDLATRSKATAQNELAALAAFAGENPEPWDLTYWSEKFKDNQFSISDEKLRPYFPARKVVPGLFELAERLYGLKVIKQTDVSVWHDGVEFYRVENADGAPLGGFYCDLYARTGKRAGAWIDECVVRNALGESAELPIGYLVCNFTAADAKSPAQLTHNEVVTLFHEFGHMLHHLLTTIDYPSIAGINGVPWDAVELPSQFMENFAWERDVLDLICEHIDTGEALPQSLYEQLSASRQFNAGLQMLRQLEFALYDFRLHHEFDPTEAHQPERVLAEVRELTGLIPTPEWNHFANSFSHIFAGGYAAGYYSYKWAEVLAADAYGVFGKDADSDRASAVRFRESILEVGGSRNILDAFVEFRGRPPSLQPLLDASGIA